MASPTAAPEALAIFQKTTSRAFFDDLCRKHCCRGRQGLFPVAVVVWLMIQQRLLGGGSLARAVQLVVQGGGQFWQPNRCKRAREEKISSNTGGYCQARQKLPTLLVTEVADHMFHQLREQIQPQAAPLFVMDGTTLRLSHVAAEDVVALYKLRWNIETDLRSLKRTVGLHQVFGKAVSMVEKEVLLAVAAYNLVRAVMALAAQRAQIPPRQLSFAGVQAAVLAALPGLDSARTDEEYNHRMDRLLRSAAQARLTQRSRPRSYTREIWGRGGRFPFRKSQPLPEPNS